jgi:hypothetical protein
MQGNGSAASATEEKKEFDIREYEATARQVTVASAEIRDLVLELHRLVDSPQLSTAISELTAVVAWRLSQIIAVFFLVLLGYRVAASRLARPRA